MNPDYVVVFRDYHDTDILGVIVSEREGIVKISHPYITAYDSREGTITLVPFCPLTDQVLFEFKKSEMKFLAPASDKVAQRFINTINAAQARQEYMEDSTPDLDSSIIIDGNNTRH